jgi:hypothetical protein
LHSLGLLLAQAFRYITPPAQSSPLIALDQNIPAAWVCQPLSLPVPVEKNGGRHQFVYSGCKVCLITCCTTQADNFSAIAK